VVYAVYPVVGRNKKDRQQNTKHMTETEYSQSGCDNNHSKFTMTDGRIEYGVITTYFSEEPTQYQLVRSPKMIEFKRYMDVNDKEKMRELTIPIDLKDIQKAERLDSFQEMLIDKQGEQEQKKVDWEARKSTWLKSIDNLYSNIKKWLAPFEKEGLLHIKDGKEVNLNEEYIGHYQAKRLDIYLGNDIISLTPRGTLIIGSYGRIDMRGPKGEIMIIEPEWDDWKFAKRTPKLETWDINEESFKAITQELV
jgi:hypothetical protein